MDRCLIETLHTEQSCRGLVDLTTRPGISVISTGAARPVYIVAGPSSKPRTERRRGSLCRLWFVARRGWSRLSNLLSRC
jgi:hypothetical protein